jgi:hypothetical protein
MNRRNKMVEIKDNKCDATDAVLKEVNAAMHADGMTQELKVKYPDCVTEDISFKIETEDGEVRLRDLVDVFTHKANFPNVAKFQVMSAFDAMLISELPSSDHVYYKKNAGKLKVHSYNIKLKGKNLLFIEAVLKDTVEASMFEEAVFQELINEDVECVIKNNEIKSIRRFLRPGYETTIYVPVSVLAEGFKHMTDKLYNKNKDVKGFFSVNCPIAVRRNEISLSNVASLRVTRKVSDRLFEIRHTSSTIVVGDEIFIPASVIGREVTKDGCALLLEPIIKDTRPAILPSTVSRIQKNLSEHKSEYTMVFSDELPGVPNKKEIKLIDMGDNTKCPVCNHRLLSTGECPNPECAGE